MRRGNRGRNPDARDDGEMDRRVRDADDAQLLLPMKLKPTKRCLSFEGCRGSGEDIDSEDSGSGRMAYCHCAAGYELREKEKRP